MKTMKENNMPNYQKNDKGHGVSVKVSYPMPDEAKVKYSEHNYHTVNFMGLGQYSDWL